MLNGSRLIMTIVLWLRAMDEAERLRRQNIVPARKIPGQDAGEGQYDSVFVCGGNWSSHTA